MTGAVTIFDFVPYIVVVAFCWICAAYRFKGKHNLAVICCMVFLFSALRFNVGWDYMNYAQLIEDRMPDIQFERMEWLGRWLMLAARHSFTQLYFIVVSFIILFAIGKVSKTYSSDPPLSVFVFLTFSLFFLQSLSIVRNFAAVAMVMYATHLFLRRKYLPYVIVVVLAAGMHASAYIGFLIPLVYLFRRFGRWVNIGLFAGTFFIGILLKNLILSFDSVQVLSTASYYVLQQETEESGPYKYVIYLMNILFLIFWNPMVRKKKINAFWLTMMNTGVCLWIGLSFQETLSFRLSLFFIIWAIILIPELIAVFPFRIRAVAKQGAMLALSALFFLNLYLLASAYNKGIIDQAGVFPYTLFFLQ